MKVKMTRRRRKSRGRIVVESSFIHWLYILYLLYACLHSKFLAKYQSAEWKLSEKTAQSRCLSFSLSMSPLLQTIWKKIQHTYPSQGRYLLLMLFTTPSRWPKAITEQQLIPDEYVKSIVWTATWFQLGCLYIDNYDIFKYTWLGSWHVWYLYIHIEYNPLCNACILDTCIQSM